MTQLVPLRTPETDALITWLSTQLPAAQPVYRGLKPANDPGGWTGTPGQSTFVGYHTVHTIPSGTLDGDLARPSIEADRIWQVSSFGADQHQAELLADGPFALLIGPLPPLAIPGRAVRWIRADVPPGAAREDPDQPSTWMAFGRYSIATTPT